MLDSGFLIANLFPCALSDVLCLLDGLLSGEAVACYLEKTVLDTLGMLMDVDVPWHMLELERAYLCLVFLTTLLRGYFGDIDFGHPSVAYLFIICLFCFHDDVDHCWDVVIYLKHKIR